MYAEMITKVDAAAEKKALLLKKHPLKYLVSSGFAGIFIGLGIILIFSIGGYMQGAPSTKILMGVSFAIALSLVVMTGTELFTGNTFVLTVGWLDKAVSVTDMLKVFIASYIGNFLGAFLLGAMFAYSGLVDQGAVMEFFQTAAIAKAGGSFVALFFKGVLCNMLVCLAIMIGFRTNDDVAKLIMVFLCLFAFITSGFEHSVANMTVYAVSLIAPGIEGVTMTHLVQNMVPVTLGNIIGGGLIIGAGSYVLK
ncbi:MAG: formate/nitrite transporter family protein [Eubacteriales bacterium]|nr:formate/nitrite transporter family protein [Eubacteriales bacterium]